MMRCNDCAKCRSFHLKDETYDIKCADSGSFKIHESRLDSFSCPTEFAMREPVEDAPGDNIMVVLKSGRDFMVHDRDISSDRELESLMKKAISKAHGMAFISLGGIYFRLNEIAAISYIGD